MAEGGLHNNNEKRGVGAKTLAMIRPSRSPQGDRQQQRGGNIDNTVAAMTTKLINGHNNQLKWVQRNEMTGANNLQERDTMMKMGGATTTTGRTMSANPPSPPEGIIPHNNQPKTLPIPQKSICACPVGHPLLIRCIGAGRKASCGAKGPFPPAAAMVVMVVIAVGCWGTSLQ